MQIYDVPEESITEVRKRPSESKLAAQRVT
jgi:hypothetical protein